MVGRSERNGAAHCDLRRRLPELLRRQCVRFAQRRPLAQLGSAEPAFHVHELEGISVMVDGGRDWDGADVRWCRKRSANTCPRGKEATRRHGVGKERHTNRSHPVKESRTWHSVRAIRVQRGFRLRLGVPVTVTGLGWTCRFTLW